MTDEEKLCEISAVLRRHNKPQGGLSASEAVYQIRKILDQFEGKPKTAEWLPIGQHMTYVCSNCKCEFMTTFDTCPYCEAYMKGETR